MKFKIFVFIFLIVNYISYGKEKIIYKYRRYEKINFEEISIDGDKGLPGDITISENYFKKFENKLPQKENFNFEMYKGLERVR